MTEQKQIGPFREMNRYDRHDADFPSEAVYGHPRRTLNNSWRKYHADRDCGSSKVRYLEQTTHRPSSDRYEFYLFCHECGHEIPEDEVLFIGGEWWHEHGWIEYGRTIEDVFLPPERVCDLGPDPDQDALRDALRLTRIENSCGPSLGGVSPESWKECSDCGHAVPLRFDDRCRMCYDGPWTERMQSAANAFERKVREGHNNSFVHRLESQVDPCNIHDRAFEDKILWRRHAAEPVPKLVEVTQVLTDESDGHREYILTDLTHTREWRYRQEDLVDCFWDTGLYNEHTKPIEDERLRGLWERLCKMEGDDA